MPHAKVLAAAEQRNQPNQYAARVSQYTTLNLLPDVAKIIDDIHYENFHVPVLNHQARVVRRVADNEFREVGHVYAEQDYVDAQVVHEYVVPDFPLREQISVDDLVRLDAVNEAFLVALSGRTIPISLLKRALTVEQLRQFAKDVTEVVEVSEIQFGDGVPVEFRSYNKKLNKADFMWARFEATPTHSFRKGKTKRNKTGKLEDRAESLYEDALEELCEIFGCAHRGDWGFGKYAELLTWLDREFYFDAAPGHQLDISAHSMPRVRGSKSAYAEDSGLPKLSKRLKRQYCALNALLVAGCDIAFIVPYPEITETSDADKQKLQIMLKKLKTKH